MIGILIMTIMGLISSLIISFLSYDKTDKILKFLPMYNCNKCGFGSCKGMALNATKNIESLKKCRFLSKETLDKLMKE